MNESIKEKIEFNSNKRLEMLKNRSKRCVCKYCGGELKVKQIIFSSYEEARVELFCRDCDRIEFGVEPEIYDNAKYFVEETGFSCYPDLDDSLKVKQMTIAKICEIMTWENQNIGILTPEGFNIELNANKNYVGECVTLSDSDLKKEI